MELEAVCRYLKKSKRTKRAGTLVIYPVVKGLGANGVRLSRSSSFGSEG